MNSFKVRGLYDYKDDLLIDERNIIYKRHPTDPRPSRCYRVGKKEKELRQLPLDWF